MHRIARPSHVTPAVVAALAAVALAGGGCRNPISMTSGDPPIRTDRTEYVMVRSGDVSEVDIGFTYTNPTAGPVNVQGCRGPQAPSLEKQAGDGWVAAYHVIELLCLGPPLVIPRGGSYRYGLHVRAHPRGSNSYPQFLIDDIPGTYRLVWSVHAGDGKNYYNDGGGPLLPLAQRVSNTFRISQ